MNIELDMHTHTIASGHAYSSLNEMALAAAEKGLKVMATTDHAPAMPGGAHIYHFHNLRSLPEIIHGVRILKGVEANIINYNGGIDVPVEVLEEMELVIASLHAPCIEQSTSNKITEALLQVMNNPYVDIIGHPEDKRFLFDLPEVIKASKDSHTLLELNNSSLLPTSFREGSQEGYIKILELCANEEVPIIMGSDAHHSSNVGRFDMALKLVDEIGFPKHLIINRSVEKFMAYRNK